MMQDNFIGAGKNMGKPINIFNKGIPLILPSGEYKILTLKRTGKVQY